MNALLHVGSGDDTHWMAAALLVVLVDLAVLLVLRPRRVVARPPSTATGPAGPERPAVAHLLTHRWRLGPEAVTATVVDLIGRGLLIVDQVGDQPVRLRPGRAASTGDGITGFERLVLDDVRALAEADAEAARDGSAPSALRSRHHAWWHVLDVSDCRVPDAARLRSRLWQRRFEDAVRAEARRRRLSRPRCSGVVLLGLAAVPMLAAVVAPAFEPLVPWAAEVLLSLDPTADEGLAILVGLGHAALVARLWRRPLERDTPEGRRAAARWLARRHQLEADGGGAHGPSARTDRAAERIALGLPQLAGSDVAVRPASVRSDVAAWPAPPTASSAPLALGVPPTVPSAPDGPAAPPPVCGRRIWSGCGGSWRRLDIDYRGSMESLWGAAAVVLILAAVAVPTLLMAEDHYGASVALDRDPFPSRPFLSALVLVPLSFVALLAGRAASGWRIGGPWELEGLALISGPVRGREGDRLVVDTGSGHRLTALHFMPLRWRNPHVEPPAVGSLVRVRATKQCQVTGVEVLSPTSQAEPRPAAPPWGPLAGSVRTAPYGQRRTTAPVHPVGWPWGRYGQRAHPAGAGRSWPERSAVRSARRRRAPND